MADTGTAVVDVRSKLGIISRIDIDWTSHASTGLVELAVSKAINGILLALITDPDGGAAPDDNYDVTILDDKGIDILLDRGLNRDTANVESVPLDLNTGQPRPTATTSFTFKVANAGNSKQGFVQLLFR
jgi:hypothetical protein